MILMLNFILSVVLAGLIHELGHYLTAMFLGHTLEFRRQGFRFIWGMPNDTQKHQRLIALSGFGAEILAAPLLYLAGLALYPWVVVVHMMAYPFYAGDSSDFQWLDGFAGISKRGWMWIDLLVLCGAFWWGYIKYSCWCGGSMRAGFLGAVVVAVALFLCAEGWAMDAPAFYSLAKKQAGINAFGATVQSAHETGHWTSPLWRNTFNGAGLKAPPPWRASKPYVEFVSPEAKDGVYYKKSSYFRKYASPEEFLSDYALKIKIDYPRCTADNTWGYFAGLYKGRLGKWATDHKYFEKLAKKAVALEPVLLSQGHLKRSLFYAIDKNYLEDWQIKIIEAVMR